ncbi:MAG TPA: hypothetical protein VGL56_01235 [Fimbriimonadaceae bacterium]|jgi:hypothetical protein
MISTKGLISINDRSYARKCWAAVTPEERIKAVFELRDFYYNVLHPGTAPNYLDKTVGGTRKLTDPPLEN